MLIKDTEQWANHLFKHAELGDERRTKRLVKISPNGEQHRKFYCESIWLTGLY